MENINRVTLLGYVGRDPSLKTFQNGNLVSNFTLATSYTYKDKVTGEKKSQTDWHRIVCFSQIYCNIIQNYVRKGSHLYLEGTLKTREWENQNKDKRYITEIVLNEYQSKLILLDKKDKNDEHEDLPNLTNLTTFQSLPLLDDDEIPF